MFQIKWNSKHFESKNKIQKEYLNKSNASREKVFILSCNAVDHLPIDMERFMFCFSAPKNIEERYWSWIKELMITKYHEIQSFLFYETHHLLNVLSHDLASLNSSWGKSLNHKCNVNFYAHSVCFFFQWKKNRNVIGVH